MKSRNSTKICITTGMFSLLFSYFHLKVIKRQKQILIGVGSGLGARNGGAATEEGFTKGHPLKIGENVQNYKTETELLIP